MPFKDPPLQIDVNHPDKDKVRIKLNGEQVYDFVSVDVLGCVGVRHARDYHGYFMFDADGFPFMEKVHGNFVIEWKPEPEPELSANFPFFGLPDEFHF